MTTTPTLPCESCGGDIRVGASFCPHCGKQRSSPAPDQRQAVSRAGGSVPGKDKKIVAGKPRWVYVIAVFALAFAAYLFFDNLPGGDHPVIALQPALEADPGSIADHADQVVVNAEIQGDELTIPLGVVRAKRIVEFEYSDGTVTVPLLAFITGEGKLVTAYRMCEPCNSKKFSIDGDRLSCGNCETQWSLNTLEGLQGTCQKYAPEPFPSRIEGDLVVMTIAQVKKWQIRL